ncbi:MAG: DNA adenine methylase [Bacteroidales bacterium]|nr:DNA adenine methylase [Bacteroidales bacterium]
MKKSTNAILKSIADLMTTELIERLQKIIAKRDKIFVSNLDALVFLKQIRDENAFVYIDPPYYSQGKALYFNYYNHEEHVLLANLLRNSTNFHWVLSYDCKP